MNSKSGAKFSQNQLRGHRKLLTQDCNSKDEVNLPGIKIIIYNKNPQSKLKKPLVSPDMVRKMEKLPRVRSKLITHRNNRVNYSRWVPKIHDYKPLFHDRNKSFNFLQELENEHSDINNKLHWLDY
jgi:hypothetical protein